MRVNGVQLNVFQTNFVKELMGDVFMTDTRAEAQLSRLSLKYDVDVVAMLESSNVRFAVKSAELKKLEAAESAV